MAAGLWCVGWGTQAAWARFVPPTCKNGFTPEQEIAEGQKVAAQVYQQMPVLPESDPLTQYVQRLGARLAAQAPGPRWPLNYHVVAVQDINAFALPGGAIFVNVGTIRAAETEAQLAGVIAHETSHVVLRHSTCNITAQQSKKVLYGIGSVLSSVLLGDSTAGSLAQAGLGLGENLQFLRMSRDAEKQADLLGTDMLYDTGYDPRGMPQFFETIQAKYGAGGAQLLSDHPNPGNRTEYVTAEIRTLPPRQGSTVTSAEFTRVHGLAMTEPVFTAQQVQAGAWKRAGRYASGAGGAASQNAQGGNAQAQGQSSSGQSGSGQTGAGQPTQSNAAAVRLSRTALGVGGQMARFQGDRFAMSFPANWQHTDDANDAVTFFPSGGASSGGVAYGAVVGFVLQPGDGVSDAATLAKATTALVEQLSQQNGGLQQVGRMTSTTVNGRAAITVELRGRSPIADAGTALTERDRLVTFVRADGDVSYIVFVAPERDMSVVRPVFDAMTASFQSQ